eukprot:1885045-Pyramimonas_sp.AAC.1
MAAVFGNSMLDITLGIERLENGWVGASSTPRARQIQKDLEVVGATEGAEYWWNHLDSILDVFNGPTSLEFRESDIDVLRSEGLGVCIPPPPGLGGCPRVHDAVVPCPDLGVLRDKPWR